MHLISGRKATALLLASVVAASLGMGGPATASAPPSLGLVVANSHIVVQRAGKGPVQLDPGVFVTALGGSVELRIARPDYDTPVGIDQLNASNGRVIRSLPPGVLDGWYGLKDFLHTQLTNASGKILVDQTTTFCPNGYDRQRVNDTGPMQPSYPDFCSANPFTKGMIWGIDRGWAVNPFNYYFYGLRLSGPDGVYHLTVSIGSDYATLFGIPSSEATANVDITLQTVGPRVGRRPRAARQARTTAVPTNTHPNARILPDIAALPAWGISIDQQGNKTYLDFGATAWNGGPQPLVVEGFRRPNTDLMDAYEYFYRNGRPVARAPVGTFMYDSRLGHEHWHFEQFANYALLDATRSQSLRSNKTGFCIAPTDAIDLAARGADWHPYNAGLFSACGSSGAIWTREALPAGWGDTYYQALPGQSFNITNLPNGTYYIRVTVNPLGALYETNGSDNVQLRQVILRGKPGHRRVTVPPWHGIDTEGGGCLPFCFGG